MMRRNLCSCAPTALVDTLVSRTQTIEWPRPDFGPLTGSFVSMVAGTPCTHWMSELKRIRMGSYRNV